MDYLMGYLINYLLRVLMYEVLIVFIFINNCKINYYKIDCLIDNLLLMNMIIDVVDLYDLYTFFYIEY